MAPLRFDKARIEALLVAASEQLDGEWLSIAPRCSTTVQHRDRLQERRDEQHRTATDVVGQRAGDKQGREHGERWAATIAGIESRGGMRSSRQSI